MNMSQNASDQRLMLNQCYISSGLSICLLLTKQLSNDSLNVIDFSVQSLDQTLGELAKR